MIVETAWYIWFFLLEYRRVGGIENRERKRGLLRSSEINKTKMIEDVDGGG